jgi:hypothetical protein
MSTPFIIEPKAGGKNERRWAVTLITCHSEVLRGILPDPSEYLGVTGAKYRDRYPLPARKIGRSCPRFVTTPPRLGLFHTERNGAH